MFDRFLDERRILLNVSPKTLHYYPWVKRAFEPILTAPAKEGMMACVQRMLAHGVRPISINTYLRGFKAYCRWLHAEGHLTDPFKISFLKVESKVLSTLTADHIRRLVTFKPTGRNQTRCHVAIDAVEG